MSKLAEKILKYAHGKKSLKAPFAIYLDLEYLLKKEQSCQNNPEKLYTKKKAEHEPSGWAMFTKDSFMQQKISSTITEEGIVLKNYVKSWKSTQWK